MVLGAATQRLSIYKNNKKMFKILYFLIGLCISLPSYSQGQLTSQKEPVIDFKAIEDWPQLGGLVHISANGKYVLYRIENQPVGSSTTIVQSTDNSWKKAFVGISGGIITEDSRRIVWKQGDSLCLLTLGSNEMAYIPNISRYELFTWNKKCWLAYEKTAEDKALVLRDLNSGKEERLSEVEQYQFESQKRFLYWQSKKSDGSHIRYTLHRMDLAIGRVQAVRQDAKIPTTNWVFNESGNTLLYTTTDIAGNDTLNSLHWYGTGAAQEKMIWKNRKMPGNSVFDQQGQQLTFFAGDTLWYYKKGMDKMLPMVTNNSPGIGKDVAIDTRRGSVFSKDGHQVLFYLVKKQAEITKASPDAVKLDVWNYRDKELQSVQQMPEVQSPNSFAVAINVGSSQVIRIEREGENAGYLPWAQKQVLVHTALSPSDEWCWQKGSEQKYFLVSLQNGSRTALNIDTRYIGPIVTLSPNSDYVIYYDPAEDGYCSYQIAGGITRHLTKDLGVSWRDERTYRYFNTPNPFFGVDPRPRGIAGWTDGDSAPLVYDDNDIWKLDPSGLKKPVNITNGYGRKFHIRFGINQISNDEMVYLTKKPWILDAFNEDTKEAGFFRIIPDKKAGPEMLTMGPYSRGSLVKARDADTWGFIRSSSADAPNLYITRDNFKTINLLTDIQPQKGYNWYTTELVNWKLSDGDTCQGLLFKPENFDPVKKYPLIFNYYEQSSGGAFAYFAPGLVGGSEINIPYFVSRGYMVFMPDIHYKMGHPGQSVLNTIESVAKELGKRPYVDSKRMGLAGHSWGGYETNYIVTHSQLFAAAAESAGPTDFISDYNGGLYGDLSGGNGGKGIGFSKQSIYEIDQARMGVTLWQRPDLYAENSPILKADQVTTPLLILHNKLDGAVAWSQGVELFTALRRLQKPCWMLQYDGEGHGLSDPKNVKDYTIRLTQFFDHYLKDAPPPRWMTTGIPASMKGIDDGLQLDSSGKQP
jgi:dipeptidyl aminopeptidase/acylaminoacyl peptidase